VLCLVCRCIRAACYHRDGAPALTEGYKAVDTCEDGTSAIKAAKIHSYDIFIVNCRKPSMRGGDLTRALRMNPPDTIVIKFIVECRDQDFRNTTANAFLTRDNLVQRIFSIIQGRRALLKYVRIQHKLTQPSRMHVKPGSIYFVITLLTGLLLGNGAK